MAYRFDEDFDGFLEDFGEPADNVPISPLVFEAYKDKLPEQLFVYWRALGACSFGNGLFWMTNPDEYQDLLDSWLEGSPLGDRRDLSVIARTAFGELHVWAKGKGSVMTIRPEPSLLSVVMKRERNDLDAAAEDREMRYFWGFKDPESVNETDAADKPLFARALKTLGRLKSDEMYGYAHRLALGGRDVLSNLEICKLHVYHDITQQMEPPTIQYID